MLAPCSSCLISPLCSPLSLRYLLRRHFLPCLDSKYIRFLARATIHLFATFASDEFELPIYTLRQYPEINSTSISTCNTPQIPNKMADLAGRKVFKVFNQDFIVDERYTVTKELGQGAYGIVWYATLLRSFAGIS